VVRLHPCSVFGFYPCLSESICANRRAASSYYGLAFYGRRHTLSILSFESHRVLISFSPLLRPRKGIDMSDSESILPV
jgi:hypothetical protein